jgi:ABC-type branched-subunit amino acid transport system substrate-binding protein
MIAKSGYCFRIMRGEDMLTTRTALAATIGVLAVSVAGCGSSSSSSSSSTSGGSSSSSSAPASNSQSSLTFMNVSPNNTQAQNFPEILQGAQAAEKAINAAGGVNGHQIKIVWCNEGEDANVEDACARQAVQDKVAAVVGDFVSVPSNFYSILNAAHIPAIGPNTLTAGADTSPNSFPLTAGAIADYTGLSAEVERAGIKKVAVVGYTLPAAYQLYQMFKSSAEARGITITKFVSIPINATDVTAQVASALSSGGQALECNCAAPDNAKVQLAAYQQNPKIRVFDSQQTFLPDGLKLGPAANGTVLVSFNPQPQNTPDSQQYLTEFKAAGVTTIDDFSVNAWLATHVAADVASKMSGPVTGPTLLSAMSALKGYSYSFLKNYNASAKPPLPDYPRIKFVRSYATMVQDGKIVLRPGPNPIDPLPQGFNLPLTTK